MVGSDGEDGEEGEAHSAGGSHRRGAEEVAAIAAPLGRG